MSNAERVGERTYEEFCRQMAEYAKTVQIHDNYAGDEYYMQNGDTWEDAWKDGMTPAEAVESDMSYWEPSDG